MMKICNWKMKYGKMEYGIYIFIFIVVFYNIIFYNGTILICANVNFASISWFNIDLIYSPAIV